MKSFSTLSDDTPEEGWKSARCIAVNSKTGEIVVGDYHRELVTVHNGEDFTLQKEIYVDLKPVHVAVNKKNQVAVCMMNHELNRRTDKFCDHFKVVVFDYTGDELFTIVPKISGGEVDKSLGIVYDSGCGLYIAVSKFDKSLLNKENGGHIHYYGSSGEFVKCVAKGLYWPLGMGIGKNLLAVADKKSVRVYKPE